MGLLGRSRADKALVEKLERRVAELEKLVRTGHWRNPATGRLGKKGETF